MIEVRVRAASQTTAKRLCDWPATDLDQLPRLLGQWGVVVHPEVETYTDVSGQFAVDEAGVWFELVVHDVDEDL